MKKFLIVAFILISTAAQAAISLPGTVSSGRRTGSGTGALTISHTTTSDTDAIIVAACAVNAQSFSSVVFNGTETFTILTVQTTNAATNWYVLLLPTTSTTANIVLTPSGSSSISAVAWNVKNYGGTIAYDQRSPNTGGDLTFAAFGKDVNGGMLLSTGCGGTTSQTFTPAAALTADVAQDSLADTSAKMAAGHVASTGSSQTIGYTLNLADNGTTTVLSLYEGGQVPSSPPTGLGPSVINLFLGNTGLTVNFLTKVRPQDNLLVMVCANEGGAATTLSNATFHGDAMTEIVESNGVAIYSLASPDVGTYKVNVTISINNFQTYCSAWSVRSDGVRNTATRVSSNETLNVTTVSGDLVLDLVAKQGTIDNSLVWTAGAGQTATFTQGYPATTGYLTIQMAASYEVATTTTTTMSWTLTPDSGWNTSQGVIALQVSTVPFSTFNAQRLIKDAQQ